MIDWLTTVSTRENDALTLARDRALGLAVLAFMSIMIGLAGVSMGEYQKYAIRPPIRSVSRNEARRRSAWRSFYAKSCRSGSGIVSCSRL